jgi:probable rRNA maturation factor
MRNLPGQVPLANRIDRVPVLLRNLQRSTPINMKRIRGIAEDVLAAMHVQHDELSILLVSDRRIRTLNARYRKIDLPTDVLAFPLETNGARVTGSNAYSPRTAVLLPKRVPESRPPRLLGDVVISVATAQRQATTYGHSLHKEVIRLVVHGVLHLLGYDHEHGAREARRMAGKERRVLRLIGTT